MPKALCWAGLVIAILVFALFTFDLIPSPLAPFQRASVTLDILFILCSVALAYLSWTTLREQDKR